MKVVLRDHERELTAKSITEAHLRASKWYEPQCPTSSFILSTALKAADTEVPIVNDLDDLAEWIDVLKDSLATGLNCIAHKAALSLRGVPSVDTPSHSPQDYGLNLHVGLDSQELTLPGDHGEH